MLRPQFRPLIRGAASLSVLCQSALRLNITRSYSAPVQSDAKAGAQTGFAGPPAAAASQATKMRTYKPRTPGLRHLKRPINDHLWKGRPYLPLTFPKKGHGKGGRNHSGQITVRHRGGGHKRRIRTVDFKRWTPGPHTVERIEYDPGRSAHIALLTEQATGTKSYIVAADGMRAGDVVQSYRSGIPQDLLDSMGGIIDPAILAAKTAWRGNCLPMHMIPIGTVVYNVGSRPDGRAVFCRSAGTYATIIAKDEESRNDGTKVMTGAYVTVRLQSGEIRKVSKDACATIGVSSNTMHQYRQLGKAGRSRWLNIRPTVRGLAMNASKWDRVLCPPFLLLLLLLGLLPPPSTVVILVTDMSPDDHPHGGGRGKSKGNRHPVSPWGQPAKGGFKTRPKQNKNTWVVTPRVRNMGKRRNKKSS